MAKNNSSANTLFLVGGGFVLWYLLTRIQTIGNLNFVPRGLGIVGNAVSVILGIQNPTSNALLFNSLSGDLMVNGNSVGNVADFQPVTIMPNSETPITLLITPNIFGIAANAIDQISNGLTGGISAKLQAIANVNNTPVPVNVQFIQ